MGDALREPQEPHAPGHERQARQMTAGDKYPAGAETEQHHEQQRHPEAGRARRRRAESLSLGSSQAIFRGYSRDGGENGRRWAEMRG
jgi:hypothetical protein